MTKAIVHIGLPKTGTSSFQMACVKAHATLVGRGTLYPLDAWLTYGAMQHQALAIRVKNGDERSIDEDVRKLREQARGYRELLLSAERFSGIFHSPKNAPRMRAFRDSLVRHFDDVKFVCVVRADRALLRSTIGAKFDGQGMRWDGPRQVRELVESFYGMNRSIVETLGDRLCVLRFEDLVAGSFPASLLGATLGEAIDVPAERENVSSEKDSLRFLMSNVRALLKHVLDEPTPNTPNVWRAASEIERGIAVSPESNRRIRDMLDEWLDDRLETALCDVQDSLDDIYREFLPASPPLASAYAPIS